MKTLIAFLFMALPLLGHGALELPPLQQVETCCLCFADRDDAQSTGDECARWLKDNGARLGCQYSQVMRNRTDLGFNPFLRCERVEAYGAFHGQSFMYQDVLEIPRSIAKKLDPHEVNYDGSSCMVFNNVELVQAEVQRLAHDYPQTRFDLRGNQNEGGVAYLMFSRPKEIASISSKAEFIGLNGQVETRFDACSKVGNECYMVYDDRGATNDSNLKFCTSDGQVVEQACCAKGKKHIGHWLVPGQACKG